MSSLLDQAKSAFDVGIDMLEGDFINKLRAANPKEFLPAADTSDGRITSRSLILNYIKKEISNKSAEFGEIICVKLKYCEMVQSDKYKIAIEIANSISSGLIMLHAFLPIPAVKIAVYLMRVGFLDEFCSCKIKQKW